MPFAHFLLFSFFIKKYKYILETLACAILYATNILLQPVTCPLTLCEKVFDNQIYQHFLLLHMDLESQKGFFYTQIVRRNSPIILLVHIKFPILLRSHPFVAQFYLYHEE